MSTDLVQTVQAVLVNESTGEIQYLPQDYNLDIVDTSLGTVSHEVEVVTVDDFRRRIRNSATSTTQSIVKPLVTPILSSSNNNNNNNNPIIRNTPTLLRNSRPQRQQITPILQNVSQSIQSIQSIPSIANVQSLIQNSSFQNVQSLQSVNTIEFLPVSGQFNISSLSNVISSSSPSILPPASAQFLRSITDSSEESHPQLIVYNCGDNQFDIIDQDNVQLRLCEVLEEGDEEHTNTIYICEQGEDDESSFIPEEEYSDIQVVEELPILQDEDGNVYEVEELHEVQEPLLSQGQFEAVEYPSPMPFKKRKSRLGGREAVPAKISKRPLNELKCMEEGCHFSGVNIAELRKHLGSVHNFGFEEEVISFPSDKDFKIWREHYERERMVSFIFRGGTKKVSRDQAVTYLICHRSGHYKPTMKDQSLRKRKMKPQGSCKMNGYCTAGIKLCKSLESGEIRCEICHTHYGHPLDNGAIPHLRVNNVLRKIILKKFEEGMNFNQVVQYLHHNPDRLEGLRLLDRRAVRNIYDKYRKNPEKCFLDLEDEDLTQNLEETLTEPVAGESLGSVHKDTLITEPGSEPVVKTEPEEAHVVTIHIQNIEEEPKGPPSEESESPDKITEEVEKSSEADQESVPEDEEDQKKVTKKIIRKPRPNQKMLLKSGKKPVEVDSDDTAAEDGTELVVKELVPEKETEEDQEKSVDQEEVSPPAKKGRTQEEDVEKDESKNQDTLMATESPAEPTPKPAKKRGRKPKQKPEPLPESPPSEPELETAGASIRRSTRERKPKLFADDDQPARARGKSESKSDPKLDKPEAADSKQDSKSEAKSDPPPEPPTKTISNPEPEPLLPVLKTPSSPKKKPEPPIKKPMKRKASNDPPKLTKISPVSSPAAQSEAEPPTLSLSTSKTSETLESAVPDSESAPPEPPKKSKQEKLPKAKKSENPEIITEGLKETIQDLLQHGESGPTVLMYKKPGTLTPEFGRKDPRLQKEDFLLIIQTPVQRQLMQMFSDVVSLDGHKGRPRDLKLMWVIVLDEFREAIPVAWLITNSTEDRIISVFLRVLQSYTGDLTTRYVQAPNGSEYSHLWSTIFKCSPKLLLSEEETRREMRIEVAENFADSASRKKLNSFINSMMTAFSPSAFGEALEEMQNYLETEHLEKGSVFWKAFHDNWLTRAGDWDLVHRVGAPVNTINASFAFGKLKKFIAFKGTKILNSCIDPVLKIGYDRCFSRSKRIFKGDQKLLKVMEDMEVQHSWASEMNPDCFQLLGDYTYWVKDEKKDCSFTVFDVQSPCRCKFVCPKCEVCLHRFICNCPLSTSDERAMCSHIHFARMMSQSLVVPMESSQEEEEEEEETEQEDNRTTVQVTQDQDGNTVTIIVNQNQEESLGDEDTETTTQDLETTVEGPETIVEDPETAIEDPETTIEDPETTIEDPETTIEDPETSVEDPEVTVKDTKSTLEAIETVVGEIVDSRVLEEDNTANNDPS